MWTKNKQYLQQTGSFTERLCKHQAERNKACFKEVHLLIEVSEWTCFTLQFHLWNISYTIVLTCCSIGHQVYSNTAEAYAGLPHWRAYFYTLKGDWVHFKVFCCAKDDSSLSSMCYPCQGYHQSSNSTGQTTSGHQLSISCLKHPLA